MRGSYVMLIAALAALAPTVAAAQSESATVGWIGFMLTPVGGMAPTVPASVGSGETPDLGFRGRYAHWQFDDDDDNTTNLALGVTFPARGSSVTLEVGRSMERACDDCAYTFFGLDAYVPMWSPPMHEGASTVRFAVGLQPALGFMTQDGFSALTGAASVPLSVTLAPGRVTITPFVSPGFGLARLAGDTDSEIGTRFMLGGGAAIADAAGRFQVSASARRVFIDMEDAPTVVGLALSFHP